MRRRRATLYSVLLLTGSGIAVGLWMRGERRQSALDRQLIAALVKNDTEQALILVNSGADPNAPCQPLPPPSLRQLWNHLLRRSPTLKSDGPSALLIACGAYPIAADGTPSLQITEGPYSYGGSSNPVSEREHPHLVEAMLQHGGNIEARDQDTLTPLMWAALEKYPKTVEVLLQHKASVTARDAGGRSALYFTIQYDLPKDPTGTGIVRLLLEHGADPNQIDRVGTTLLQLAQSHAKPDVITLLRKYGARK